jgi:hypothetical protein
VTRTVLALHAPDKKRLGDVAFDMLARGLEWERGLNPSPLILGYDEGGEWQAICGSHRIAAAVALGVPVTLVWLDPDEPITTGAQLYAIGEILPDLPTGLTPREIVEFREAEESGVRYQVEVSRG